MIKEALVVLSVLLTMTIIMFCLCVCVRKMEVVPKQVRGCLISYNLQLVGGFPTRCVHCRVNPSDWTKQSVPYVGIELLGQLKSK